VGNLAIRTFGVTKNSLTNLSTNRVTRNVSVQAMSSALSFAMSKRHVTSVDLPGSSSKRTRQQLTLEDKRAIVQFHDNNPNWSHEDIAAKFNCGRSTVSKAIKQREEWENVDSDSALSIRRRYGDWPAMEQSLYVWIGQASARNIPITDEIAKTKAQDFVDGIYGDEPHGLSFSASNGWLAGFKQRYGLKSYRMHGEAGSSPLENLPAFRQQIREKLALFDLENIFNADETALFFRMLPTQTLATTAQKGTKKDKERVTILLTANATGTTKLKPLIIGRSAQPRYVSGAFSLLNVSIYTVSPRCFGRTKMSSLPHVTYRSNQKAWMTMTVFEEWLKTLNNLFRIQNRKILLLIDNASSHGWDRSLSLDYVQVEFLPPNTTAHLQPMDSGIIANFKVKYRTLHVRHLVEEMDRGNDVKKLDLRKAIEFVAKAWNNVDAKTISNCWLATGIVSNNTDSADVLADVSADAHAEISNLLSELAPVIANPMPVEQYLSIENELGVETERMPTDEEIIKTVVGPKAGEGDENDSEDGEEETGTEETKQTAPELWQSMEVAYALEHVLRFWENAGEDEEAEEQYLACLKMLDAVNTRRQRHMKQTLISDFFFRQ
jgi:DDE superfamily endonuclease/Tc5 transposase DNA-binding domain/CENP-B N-terminal DNA-binding domain